MRSVATTTRTGSPTELGEKAIAKLLVQYSVPAIIACVATSLYNIIDSIFIGRGVGAVAIAGLAITLPLMNLLVAFCTLVTKFFRGVISGLFTTDKMLADMSASALIAFFISIVTLAIVLRRQCKQHNNNLLYTKSYHD